MSQRGVVTHLHTQMMTSDEAECIATSEGLMLVRTGNDTGYWCVRHEKREGKSPRPYQVEGHFFKTYSNDPRARKSFASPHACALAVARSLGPTVSRIYAMNFPEECDGDILAGLRATPMEHRSKRNCGVPGVDCVKCGGPIGDYKSKWCRTCHAARYQHIRTHFRTQILHRAAKPVPTIPAGARARSRRGPLAILPGVARDLEIADQESKLIELLGRMRVRRAVVTARRRSIRGLQTEGAQAKCQSSHQTGRHRKGHR